MPHLQIVPVEAETRIAEILRESGVTKSLAAADDVKAQLSAAGLSQEHLFSYLASIIETGDSRDAVRLTALKTALELNGSLKPESKQPVTFNINIQNSFNGGSEGTNPILIPREVR